MYGFRPNRGCHGAVRELYKRLKFRQKLKDIKVWLYANRDQKLKKLMGMLNLKLTGHYRYYGVSFNGRMISNFKQQVREMLKYYPLVMPKIYVSLF